MTEIRNAVLSDAERLLEIFGYYVRNTAVSFDYEVPSPEQFRSKMERIAERYPFLVIERDGKTEGYAYAGPFVGRAAYGWSCETTVYIAPEARGCGLGGMLYRALEKELREMGITNMYACVGYTENEDEYLTNNSARFHEHMGFAKVGEFRGCGYKFGRWYDMIWMEKIIGEHRIPQPEVRSRRSISET